MIVVDANVIAYYFIEGDMTPLARSLHAKEPVWAVPSLWRHEFLNILATAGKAAAIPVTLLAEIWKAAFARLAECERTLDMGRALEMAVDLRISAYDAQYLALAESLGVDCVTEDGKLIRASRGRALRMKDWLAAEQ